MGYKYKGTVETDYPFFLEVGVRWYQKERQF